MELANGQRRLDKMFDAVIAHSELPQLSLCIVEDF